MRWPAILNITGVLTLVLGLLMLLPVACSLVYGDSSLNALVLSAVVTSFSGAIVCLCSRKHKFEKITQREGMAIVAVGWTAVGLFGALPFYFADIFPSFVDAFFESVSGFTTTGSTVLTNIEVIPEGLLVVIAACTGSASICRPSGVPVLKNDAASRWPRPMPSPMSKMIFAGGPADWSGAASGWRCALGIELRSGQAVNRHKARIASAKNPVLPPHINGHHSRRSEVAIVRIQP